MKIVVRTLGYPFKYASINLQINKGSKGSVLNTNYLKIIFSDPSASTGKTISHSSHGLNIQTIKQHITTCLFL